MREVTVSRVVAAAPTELSTWLEPTPSTTVGPDSRSGRRSNSAHPCRSATDRRPETAGELANLLESAEAAFE